MHSSKTHTHINTQPAMFQVYICQPKSFKANNCRKLTKYQKSTTVNMQIGNK